MVVLFGGGVLCVLVQGSLSVYCLTKICNSAGVASAIKTVHIKLIGLSNDPTCKSN